MNRKVKKRFLIGIIFFVCIFSSLLSETRDRWHQPEKVMDVVGVKPGMVIGEVGAGRGYFTFKLAKRVGKTGKVYANDISKSALDQLRNRANREGFSNIETIIGEIEDPLLPDGLDMVFIVNALHDIARPVPLLNNLMPSLNPDAYVVIIDRVPEKYRDTSGHFMLHEEILEEIEESDFELDRVEAFLPQHNIYILRTSNSSLMSIFTAIMSEATRFVEGKLWLWIVMIIEEWSPTRLDNN